jgi:hypothetical protein
MKKYIARIFETTETNEGLVIGMTAVDVVLETNSKGNILLNKHLVKQIEEKLNVKTEV